jgi:copper chaperone
MERSYTVVGMTCDHCVAAVREEVGQITGVSGVEVDLRTGRLDVASASVIPVDQVREAVEEAGYELKETS